MLIRMALVLLAVNLLACSTSVTSPVTRTKYKVDVGCTEDMQRYKQEREEVTGKKQDKIQAKDIKLECPPTEP